MKKRQLGVSWHQGTSIKAALRRAGITQQDVAVGAGLNKATVGLWLQGKIGSDRIAESLRKLMPDWCEAHLQSVYCQVDPSSSGKGQQANIAG